MRIVLRLAVLATAVGFVLPVLAADDTPTHKVVKGNTTQIRVWRYDSRVISVQLPGNQSLDIHPLEDAKVYLTKPPAAFDDKGNLKTYTSAELTKLKGKNPGYPGDFDNIKQNTAVQLQLATKVPVKPLKKGETDPEKGKVYYMWVLTDP